MNSNSSRLFHPVEQLDINRALHQNIGVNTTAYNNKKGTWILLRGLLRDKRHWGDFPRLVHERLQADRVVCLEIAGNGQKSNQISPNTIAGMVDDLRADLKKLVIKAPVKVIALSMGAMITTDWLSRYPKDIAKAVLINTSMKPFSLFYQRLRPANYGSLISDVFCGQMKRREELILNLTSNQSRSVSEHANLLQQWLGYQRENSVSAGNAWRQLSAARHFSGPSKLDTHPILLLASKKDRLVNCQCSQAIAYQWNCPFAMHPEAGHDLSLDAPNWVIEQILAHESNTLNKTYERRILA